LAVRRDLDAPGDARTDDLRTNQIGADGGDVGAMGEPANQVRAERAARLNQPVAQRLAAVQRFLETEGSRGVMRDRLIARMHGQRQRPGAA